MECLGWRRGSGWFFVPGLCVNFEADLKELPLPSCDLAHDGSACPAVMPPHEIPHACVLVNDQGFGVAVRGRNGLVEDLP